MSAKGMPFTPRLADTTLHASVDHAVAPSSDETAGYAR